MTYEDLRRLTRNTHLRLMTYPPFKGVSLDLLLWMKMLEIKYQKYSIIKGISPFVIM